MRFIPYTSLCLALLFSGPSSAGGISRISSEEWSRPRDGSSLIAMPALNERVQELLREPQRHLVVRYPGGEEGVLWAEELRGWLVALGIAGNRIDLVPGGPDPDAIELMLGSAREWSR